MITKYFNLIFITFYFNKKNQFTYTKSDKILFLCVYDKLAAALVVDCII